jgi:LysM repeat protein
MPSNETPYNTSGYKSLPKPVALVPNYQTQSKNPTNKTKNPQPRTAEVRRKRPPDISRYSKETSRHTPVYQVDPQHVSRIKPTPKDYKPKNGTRADKPETNGLKTVIRKYSATIGRLTSILVMTAVLIGLCAILIRYATHHNAYVIFLNGEPFAYIVRNDDLEEGTINAQAIRRLELRLNAQVQVNERITIQTVRNRSGLIPYDEAIERLSQELTFMINAYAIVVDGVQMAVIRNSVSVEGIFERLKAPYLRDDIDYVSVDFVQDVQIVPISVGEDELDTVSEALQRLEARQTFIDDYIIQSGDSLYSIALRHRVTRAQLIADNPGYTEQTILQPGRILKVENTRPFLSVRTVEEQKRTEPISFGERERENTEEPVGHRRVIEHGVDGLLEHTIHLTRVNGAQFGAEQVVGTITVREPINQIV